MLARRQCRPCGSLKLPGTSCRLMPVTMRPCTVSVDALTCSAQQRQARGLTCVTPSTQGTALDDVVVLHARAPSIYMHTHVLPLTQMARGLDRASAASATVSTCSLMLRACSSKQRSRVDVVKRVACTCVVDAASSMHAGNRRRALVQQPSVCDQPACSTRARQPGVRSAQLAPALPPPHTAR